MSALPLTSSISQKSAKTTEYRITRVAFGNGYEQRSMDGLNSKRDSWTLIWENLNATDLGTLTSFFDGLGGAAYFTWTAFTDSTSKNWITTSAYTIQVLAGNLYNLNVSIQQVYDL